MAAAKRALAIDDNLAEAHTTLGALTMFYLLDWATAEREYKRAIELNPNYPQTYELYSYLLSAMGRLDESLSMAKRGLDADPLSLTLNDDVASVYYLARRHDESIAQYQTSLQIEPERPGAFLGLAMAYLQKGMYEEAIKNFDQCINKVGRIPSVIAPLGVAYVGAGKKSEAIALRDELTQLSRTEHVSPYDLAVFYTGLSDKKQAITYLNKAFEERAGWIIYLKVEPLFDPLRSEPGFAELVRRTGLPQ